MININEESLERFEKAFNQTIYNLPEKVIRKVICLDKENHQYRGWGGQMYYLNPDTNDVYIVKKNGDLKLVPVVLEIVETQEEVDKITTK